MKKLIIAFAVIGTLAACGNNDTTATDEKAKQEAQEKLANPEPMSSGEAQIDITGMTVEARDPYCNMKIGNKVADTATIDGKFYGFCAKTCKEKYLEELAAKQ